MSTAHGEQVRVLEEHEGLEGSRSLNWWGMVFFISSEALIFANLIAAYLYLEIRNGGVGWRLDSWQFSLVNTLFLLASSGTMHWAGTGIRKGNTKQLFWGLVATIALGAIFLGGQAYEYFGLATGPEHLSMSKNIFGSAFFTLTGFHGLHVSIGVLILIITAIRARLGHFTQKSHFGAEAAEMYWHFVDGVWILVFFVVYILPLFHS
jgi:heme/copper-type cytochrome/quinol oxidase subunit 3